MESLVGPSYKQYHSSELSEPTSSGFPSSGPSSSSSRAESTDTASTEVPGSASKEEESHIVPSLLDKLKAPKSSNLAHKRKIAANLSCGKRRSCGPRGAIGGSDLKTIQQEKHVRDYPNELLTVSNGRLLCCGCREGLCYAIIRHFCTVYVQ